MLISFILTDKKAVHILLRSFFHLTKVGLNFDWGKWKHAWLTLVHFNYWASCGLLIIIVLIIVSHQEYYATHLSQKQSTMVLSTYDSFPLLDLRKINNYLAA
jgi:hypothetical protein